MLDLKVTSVSAKEIRYNSHNSCDLEINLSIIHALFVKMYKRHGQIALAIKRKSEMKLLLCLDIGRPYLWKYLRFQVFIEALALISLLTDSSISSSTIVLI